MVFMKTPGKETELSHTPKVYKRVRPEVCVNSSPGKAKNTWPIVIPLKRDAGTPNLKQHPVRQEEHFSHRLTYQYQPVYS